jgi:DNA-binding XRE family transcriptional regulator
MAGHLILDQVIEVRVLGGEQPERSIVDNPYRRLRLACSINQKDFGAKYGFSHATMNAIEGGQVIDLSERMVLSLGQECAEHGISAAEILGDEYGVTTLREAYENWKSNERAAFSGRFQKPLSGAETWEESPFSVYMQEVAGTMTAFAKMLKVPLAAVQRYANGKNLTMPKAVEEALTQVQFVDLDDLKDVQTKWVGVGMFK